MDKSTGYLRVLTGPQKGGVFVLKDLSVFDIGKGDGCQVKLDDTNISFSHARVYRKNDTWTFYDLNSDSGSSINDIRVEKRELDGQEIIRVGTTEMHFSFTAPPAGNVSGTNIPAAAGAPAPVAVEAPGEYGGISNGGGTKDDLSSQIKLRPPAPAPVAQAPVAQAPVAQAPVAQAPVAQRPVPQAPVHQAPVHQAPVHQAPVHQAPVAAPPVAGVAPTSAGPFRLKVIDGATTDLGKVLHLDPENDVVIGRSDTCNLVLNDGKVSRLHCRIECSSKGFLITDLNSANGSIVNGERISQATLGIGDYVRLGFTVMTYEQVPVEVY